MSNWLANDLKVELVKLKMIELTKEYDKNNDIKSENYEINLQRFIQRRMKYYTDIIMKEQIVLTMEPLFYRKAFKV